MITAMQAPVRRTIARLAGVAGLCLLVASFADAASPNVGNVLPRGGQRGAEVELRFVGGNLADAVDLVFHEPGIAFKQIVSAADGEFKCVVTIAPDCALGRHALRVRTTSGISNVRIFSVGALPEVMETEPNNDSVHAQAMALGTTVNGIADYEDVDYFAVDLAAGATLSAEVEAIRLGHALFDAKLRLFGPSGGEVLSEDDTAAMRQDAAFVYIAKDAGRYLVAVSEAAYGGSGDYEYRLHLGQFPRPFAVTPMGGAPGAPVKVRWLGDPAMAEGEVTITAPLDRTTTVEPANDHGFAPTPLAFRASSLPDAMEIEPNNAREQATSGQGPGAFDGVISEKGDVDWFAFDGTKGQVYDLRVWARELGSPLDSVIEVYGPEGGKLLGNDDAAGPDSAGRVTLPADGRYLIAVRDHLGHGGPTFDYRVEMAPPAQRFSFGLINNEPGMIAVARANRAFALLNVTRVNFDGPIDVDFRDLPPGVTIDHGQIPAGQTQLPVLISASADAAPAGGLVDVHGTWKNGDAVFEGGFDHTIRLVLGQNLTVFDSYQPKCLALAVTEDAPFSIEIVQPKSPMPINSSRYLRVVATRKDGFTAPIDLSAPWLPQGCGVPAAQIPADQTETQIRLEVRGDAPRGEFPLLLTGDSSGYRVATPFAKILVEEPWLALEIGEIQGELGKPMSWPAKLTVNKPFEGEFVLEMLGMPKGVTAEQQHYGATTTAIAFPVQVAADAPEGKHGPFVINTKFTLGGEEIICSLGGAPLKLFKPLPAELQQAAAPPPPPAAAEAAAPPARKTRFPTTK
jgi:hypothetical protein